MLWSGEKRGSPVSSYDTKKKNLVWGPGGPKDGGSTATLGRELIKTCEGIEQTNHKKKPLG